mgnify:CR=1 FL=1
MGFAVGTYIGGKISKIFIKSKRKIFEKFKNNVILNRSKFLITYVFQIIKEKIKWLKKKLVFSKRLGSTL